MSTDDNARPVDDVAKIQRATRPDPGTRTLFEMEPDWRDYWWGMPAFEARNALPQYKLTMNFFTAADLDSFAKHTGLPLSTKSDSAWWPPQERIKGYHWAGPQRDSRYPICIPSKGRAKHQTTGKVLDQLGVSYKFFVEETEGDAYKAAVGENNVVVMPFHDLGQGSVPARNFIWEWALERGYARHWTLDDNILCFIRTHMNRRLRVRGGSFFKAMEDFVDRYENIDMAGPHHQGFVRDRDPSLTPVLFNSRVYSCILLNTKLAHRWRGRYNEDTDLSLRLLKEGRVTALFRALCMNKGGTVGAKGAKALPGGNTDNVYNTGDHRLAFAESLRQQHPDVVEVVWRFNRWHHLVDYAPFKGNRPVLRQGVTPTKSTDDYEMTLVETSADQMADDDEVMAVDSECCDQNEEQ